MRLKGHAYVLCKALGRQTPVRRKHCTHILDECRSRDTMVRHVPVTKLVTDNFLQWFQLAHLISLPARRRFVGLPMARKHDR